MKHKVGDKVLLRQTKTTVKLPFDPEAYEVKEIRGAEGREESDQKCEEMEAAKGEAGLSQKAEHRNKGPHGQ